MTHPSRLGKYEINAVLGEGAMGVVYKAFDPDIRRDVALKTIRRELTDGSDFAASIAARFRNEAQAAGRLAHPGIVGVYAYGEDEQVAYIAMEYVEGESIARHIANQVRFTDADIPVLMSQLLDALDHAHAQGVWHRDIKPANLILTSGGRLKVADFGIARIESAGLTQTHMSIGTPSYMAPEQFLGTPIDSRVDIYAAGVVLYVLLAGRPPFTGSSDSLMYKVVHEMPAPPSQVEGAQRPALYDAIVVKALAKDREARFASAMAFRQALLAAVGQPLSDVAWDATIVRTPSRPLPSTKSATTPATTLAATPAATPTSPGRAEGAASSTGTLLQSWDRTVLAQAQTLLAHHVGPLATVLVKRAAGECDSTSALYAKLAEQVSDPAARRAFLSKAEALTQVASGTGSGGAHASGAGAAGTAVAQSLNLSEATLDRAQRLLATYIGPIAKIVVKKSAAQSADRGSFILKLAEAVSAADRARLVADLERLP